MSLRRASADSVVLPCHIREGRWVEEEAEGRLRDGRRACAAHRAREPEKDGDVAVVVLVGGGVEAELTEERHPVHHQREDALLHLARVLPN